MKMKEVKENLVQWTDWDSKRGRRKFDKVGKHSSSTKIITANNSTNSSLEQTTETVVRDLTVALPRITLGRDPPVGKHCYKLNSETEK